MRPPVQHLQLTEEEIFDCAVELPQEERSAYVNEVCHHDPALRGRIELLLQLDAEENFMEVPATGTATLANEAKPNHLKPEQPGDQIGPYKLLEQIGEGGFGTVWIAEQEQPIRRRVALKIIKLGMDTKE